MLIFIIGTFLAWIVLRAGSGWPAVIGHAAINGIAALAPWGDRFVKPQLPGFLPDFE